MSEWGDKKISGRCWGGGGGEVVESRMDGAMYYYVSHPLVFLLSTIAREDDKIKF